MAVLAHHEVLIVAEYGLLAGGAAIWSLRRWGPLRWLQNMFGVERIRSKRKPKSQSK